MSRKSVSDKHLNNLRSTLELSSMPLIDECAVIDFGVEKGWIACKYKCIECGKDMKPMERKEKLYGFPCWCIWIDGAKRHYVSRSLMLSSWFLKGVN